jgi:hypothetical protein
MQTDHDAPRVRYATFINEDTSETTPLFLQTHEAIDDEIDQRVRQDKRAGRRDFERHRATRAKFHGLLDIGKRQKTIAAQAQLAKV